MFAERELDTVTLLASAGELVGRGILRKGFAHFLWSLKEQANEGVSDQLEKEPAKFEEILEEMGVTIPLPDIPSMKPVIEGKVSVRQELTTTLSAHHVSNTRYLIPNSDIASPRTCLRWNTTVAMLFDIIAPGRR